VIDAAVPAINAIFCHDTPAPKADDTVIGQRQVVKFETLQNGPEHEETLTKLLDSFTLRTDELGDKITDAANHIVGEVDARLKELKESLQHEKYIDLRACINLRM
jgi:hypothetical protein